MIHRVGVAIRMIWRKWPSSARRYTVDMRNSHFAELPRRQLYGGVIILWLLVTAATLALYLTSSLRAMQLQFHHVESAVYQQIAARLVTNEAVLDSFAAIHGSADSFDQSRTRRFARRILQRYPHLYALQVSQRVSQAEIAGLELRMQRSGLPRFKVHGAAGAVPSQAVVYPLIFTEPLPAGFDRIIGTAALAPPVAGPLTLPDGGIAYRISRRAGAGEQVAGDAFEQAYGAPLHVSVLIRAEALLPQNFVLPQGMRLNLGYRQAGTMLPLYAIGQLRSGWLQQLLFPNLRQTHDLDGQLQPFVLECEWQLGWGDVDLPVVLALLLLAGLALLSMLLLGRHLHLLDTRRVERESELYDLAIHDPLTGLFNRYYLERQLRRCIEEHQRYHARFGVAYIDLDRFKPVNDIYGHETGDQVLRVVAARLKNVVRQHDTVARIGGDEFVVLFEGVDSPQRVQELTHDLGEALAQPIRLTAGIFEIGASTGVAFFPDDGESVDQLLLVADKLMYATKQLKNGRLSRPARRRCRDRHASWPAPAAAC